MALPAGQYRTLRDLFRGMLSVEGVGPTDADVLSFYRQLMLDSSGATALSAARNFLCGEVLRRVLSGNASNPSDADVVSFWTQMATDSSPVTPMGTTTAYRKMRNALRGAISCEALNPSDSDVLSYFSPYASTLREVGTRSSVPDSTFSNPTNNVNSRTVLNIRGGPVTQLKVSWANWATQGGAAPVGSGGTMTMTAAVEYPAGTLVGVFKFGGLTQGMAVDGAELDSDVLVLSSAIPDNAEIVITRCVRFSGLMLYTARPPKAVAKGDASIYNDGATDRTQSGVFADDGVAFNLAPTRVMGYTGSPKDILLVGDSRDNGYNETAVSQDATGNCGPNARNIGPTRAYWRIGGSGNSAQNLIANSTKQYGLLAKALPSKIIIGMGFNDFNSGVGTDAGLRTYTTALVTQLRALAPQATILLATIATKTTSTDSWVTTVNQTVAAYNTELQAHNVWRRTAGSAGADGFVEVANYLQPTGVWGVSGGAWTDDGIHPIRQGNIQVAYTVP